jgi:hypothetical protein
MANKEQHEAALARIDQLEKKLVELTDKITALEEARDTVPKPLGTRTFSSLFHKATAHDKDDTTMPMMMTILQREQQLQTEKANCITVNGLKNSGDQPINELNPESEKVIEEFFSTLSIVPATDVKRKYLTKPKDPSKSPLLIVVMTNQAKQQLALRKVPETCPEVHEYVY